MSAKTLMIQGTGSSVGKSIMVAALCRIMHQDGFRVAPFKSQNMALNSFVTKDGDEMGRAQVVQAEAAGIEPTVDMNPVLIKPEADAKSQIVVMGRPRMTLNARDYYRHTAKLLTIIKQSLGRLRAQYDVVLIEGAGSPAEINLRRFEIVNMRIAEIANAPVLLVGDIDKGGVFASLVGTVALLEEQESDRIKGFIINKFRGDISLLKPGLDQLEKRTGKPVVGVVPYYHGLAINEEDSIHHADRAMESTAGSVNVAVIRLPRISNSTDFEPLQHDSQVRLRYVSAPWELDSPDLIIVPGSKSTMADLAHLRETGLAQAIVGKAKTGTPLIGICGGFQMLGKRMEDPHKVESDGAPMDGMGLLDVVTTFETAKTTRQITAQVVFDRGLLAGLAGTNLTGYEIHMGHTRGDDVAPAFQVSPIARDGVGHPDGATSHDGLVLGTYIHGIFEDAHFRQTLLRNIQPRYLPAESHATPPSKEEQYDRLAEIVRQSLDMPLVYKLCGIK